ncbi:MAG: pentapeptide repeat-containing protein [Planctomycetota bacterium]|nr:MAG: pentapeptide repeat-containing protein [Planctomycetota bacterium]
MPHIARAAARPIRAAPPTVVVRDAIHVLRLGVVFVLVVVLITAARTLTRLDRHAVHGARNKLRRTLGDGTRSVWFAQRDGLAPDVVARAGWTRARNLNDGLARIGLANFRLACFRNANIRLARFRNANFRLARFGNANIRLARFGNANIRLARFGNANIRLARFGNANIRLARFGNANFRLARFRNANVRLACFRNANVRLAWLTHARRWR